MSGLFSKKKPAEETILIVDIENASVGCALVRLSLGHAPKLFAENRAALPMTHSLNAQHLLAETEKALREALTHASTTAARMRNHPNIGAVGVITSASIFVSPPWTSAKISNNSLSWSIEPALKQMVEKSIRDIFDDIPLTFQAAGSAVAHTTNKLFEQKPDLLLCMITGEVTELALMQNGELAARATVPLGKHFLLRTLQSHAGLSHAEANSMLKLARIAVETPAEEALFSAGRQYGKELSAAARDMQANIGVQGILVIANEPMGEWAARNLAINESVGELFNEGATVQALHTHHLMPHLAAHAARPDLLFMIEALFVATH